MSYEQMREENLNDFMSTSDEVSAPINVIEDDEEQVMATSPQAELLRWHYRLGHFSFNKIHLLALLGILP